jgi:hypothetical protein
MKHGWNGKDLGYAQIKILQPRETEQGQPYLPILYNFPIGNGSSIDTNSALVRPFRKLMEEGKPIGKINFVFFTHDEQNYIIGSFVNTKKRLLFFPGLIPNKVTESPSDKKIADGESLHIDHISLDVDWEKWHFTFKENNGRKPKIRTRKTMQISDSLVLWFVMAVRSLDRIEKMPMRQEYRLVGNNLNELNRRYTEFVNACGGSIFPTLGIKENMSGDWYLNLEFFLSSKRNENYMREYPKTPQIYTANQQSSNRDKQINKLHTRDHAIWLNDFDGLVWIRVSKLPGRLDNEAYFIPGSDYQLV